MVIYKQTHSRGQKMLIFPLLLFKIMIKIKMSNILLIYHHICSYKCSITSQAHSAIAAKQTKETACMCYVICTYRAPPSTPNLCPCDFHPLLFTTFVHVTFIHYYLLVAAFLTHCVHHAKLRRLYQFKFQQISMFCFCFCCCFVFLCKVICISC